MLGGLWGYKSQLCCGCSRSFSFFAGRRGLPEHLPISTLSLCNPPADQKFKYFFSLPLLISVVICRTLGLSCAQVKQFSPLRTPGKGEGERSGDSHFLLLWSPAPKFLSSLIPSLERERKEVNVPPGEKTYRHNWSTDRFNMLVSSP